jgi:hypothetical protein
MFICGRSSDTHRERRWHLAALMILGAILAAGLPADVVDR